MPRKMVAKIVRAGYVGQVVTAGLLLTVATLLMFAVIGTLEPATKPPMTKNMPVSEQSDQAKSTVSNSQPPVQQQLPADAVKEVETATSEREVLVDNQLISQLWNGKITRDFGWQLHPLYQDWRYHNGVDISGGEGQIVPALTAGKVLEIYPDEQYGLTVVVASDKHLIYYSSLASVSVQENAIIKHGKSIGSMGITLSEPEPHVHLAVQDIDKKEYHNPRSIFPDIPE